MFSAKSLSHNRLYNKSLILHNRPPFYRKGGGRKDSEMKERECSITTDLNNGITPTVGTNARYVDSIGLVNSVNDPPPLVPQ